MRASSDLDLLLVHADDHTPVLERGVDWRAATDAPAPAPRPPPELLWSESADANDLAAQRWGVIAPQGTEGDRLLDLVQPLIERRRKQMGGRPVRIYHVPARMSIEEAIRWKRRGFRRGDDLEMDLPRYQLVLGDLDQVPASVQQVLGTDGFVGRLAFEHADDYRAYVEKVQRWEEHPAAAARADAILHTVLDGTPATRRGSEALMEPGRRILERRRDFGDVRVAEIRATGTSEPAPAELWRAVAAGSAGSVGSVDARPGVLVTLGHGVGAPRAGWSAARQRHEQGALSFGSGGVLSGREVAGRAFLPGGAWLALACFSAGTPDRSDYHHWLAVLGQAGHVRDGIGHVLDTLARERPFVAALPKAALASPEGPLAFIGHVDLAWAYSFLDLDDRPMRRPGRLMGVVQSLLHGERAGVALRQLARFFDEINTELTALYDSHARAGRPLLDTRARARRGHLWMLRQDLAGWMLLGDPAVRLPLAGAGNASGPLFALAHARAHEVAPRPGAAPLPDAPESPESPESIDALETAVHAVLGGGALADVARAHGLDPTALARLVARYRAAGRAAIARAPAPDADGP